MLTFHVLVVVPPGDSGRVAIETVEASIRLQGINSQRVIGEDAIPVAKNVKSDLVHICDHRSVFVPGFYEAASAQIEFSDCDFVMVRRAVLTGASPMETRMGDEFSCGQVVVRPWVIKEIGGKSVMEAYANLAKEYRGREIPVPFCMEVFR